MILACLVTLFLRKVLGDIYGLVLQILHPLDQTLRLLVKIERFVSVFNPNRRTLGTI